MLDNLALGLQSVIEPYNLFVIFLGVVMGILIGALPGLSGTSGLAILLPFTFFMDPIPALVMMVALYMASEYGGSITSITLGIPGTPPAVPTSWDGFPLTQKGLPGKALATSVTASSIGGLIGTVILIAICAPIAGFALRFGPPEYFALCLFGLAIMSNLVGKSVVKALISVAVGLLVCFIGADPFTGYPRFTFGITGLLEGVPFVAALVGLFAIGKVFQWIEMEVAGIRKFTGKAAYQPLSLKELKGLVVTIIRGSGIGALIGAVPGAGATIASLIAYNEEKRASKHPELFGTGVLQGIAAPESANNACVGGALIPLIALGIPGSGSTAVLVGALMLHGLRPGPLLMPEHPEIVYSIFVGLFLAVLLQFVIGWLGVRLWVTVSSFRASILGPFIIGLCIIGTYSLGNSMFPTILALAFGIVGYVMEKFEFPIAPMVLAIVLGQLLETNFRRTLIISGGSIAPFFTHPISLVLILIALVSFVIPFIRRRREMRVGKEGSI